MHKYLLSGILLLGTGLRIHHFTEFHWLDESNFALQALQDWYQVHEYPWRIGTLWISHLWSWFLAIAFYCGGISLWSMQIPPLIFSILGIGGIAALGTLLESPTVGLISATLLATSSWAVNMSHWGGIQSTMVPAVAWSLFFLIRGLRYASIRDASIAGAITGLAQYLYPSNKLLLVIIPMTIVLWLLSRDTRKYSRQIVWVLIACLLGFCITFLPLTIDWIRNPDLFVHRFNQIDNTGGDWHIFWLNIKRTAELFLLRGDENLRHNIYPYPMVDIVTTSFGMIAAAWALWNWKDFAPRMLMSTFILWFLVAVCTIETPNCFRIMGILVPFYIAVAIAIEHTMEFRPLLIGMTCVIALLNIHQYFWNIYPDRIHHNAFYPPAASVASDIAKHIDEDADIYVQADAESYGNIFPVLLWGKKNRHIKVHKLEAPIESRGRNVYYYDANEETIAFLSKLYPNAIVTRYKDFNRIFIDQKDLYE